METLWAFVAVAATLALVATPILAIFRARRATAKRLAALSIVALVVAAWQFTSVRDERARQSGFASASDQDRAKAAGITDPATWEAERPLIEARAAEARKKTEFDERAARAAENSRKRRAERDAESEAQRIAEENLPEDLRQEQITKRLAAQMARDNPQPKVDECRSDLKCWGEKNWVTASSHCASEVERMAKYTAEWTDGWLEAKFPLHRWRDREAGIVTHIGDKVRFQNGFGAWQNMIYECDFDPATSKILDVRVSAGRL